MCAELIKLKDLEMINFEIDVCMKIKLNNYLNYTNLIIY